MKANRVLPDRGAKSPRFGHLGLWSLSLGPNSPIPGERLELVILDTDGKIVRRMEQIRGKCTDEGYVDFFLSHNCRPSKSDMPIVDIDGNGKIANILHPDFHSGISMSVYLQILTDWVMDHGRPEYAL